MSRSLLLRLIAALGALALIAGACGGDDDDGQTATDDGDAAAIDEADGGSDDTAGEDGEADAGAEVSEPTPAPTPDGTCAAADVDPAADATDLTVKPPVALPAEAPTELVTEDLVTGDGAAAASGDYVIMQYVGVSCSTGEQFDASWDRGQPFPFVLGEGSVIAGWDQGIEGMTVGSRRVLTIPPDLGYGDQGSGSGSILPGETLIFVVDLIGLVPADATLVDPEVPAEPATELVTEDLVVGEGAEAGPGSLVWVHYRGVGQESGEQFDASIERGFDQPFAFVLGSGQVIAGWEQGIEGMQVGGVRQITIPADLAYGDAGAGGGLIAPGETIVFTVELYAVL